MAVRLIAVLALGFGWLAAHAADWPQAGGNPQHTSFTPDSPAPPYKVAWVADFSPEQVYSAQPVIADGRLFQTTLNGSLYALDAATGKRLWHFKAGECVWGSAAAGIPATGGEGRAFVAAWDGLVYGLDAASGTELWRHDAGEPLSGSPCIAEGMVFIGTRKGTMLALGTDGRLKWKQPLSWHIYSTAAWDAGRVFVVTEDLLVHCLDAKSGRPVWKSQKLSGLLFREFYPVAHKGKVLVSLTPAEWRDGIPVKPFVWEVGKELLDKFSAPINPSQAGRGAPRRMAVRDGKLPAEIEEGQRNLLAYYEANPHLQTLYVLNASDGKQAYVAVHLYGSAGLQNVVMPPAVCADGTVVTYCCLGGAVLARLNPETNRWVDFLLELGATNNDESEFDSVGGSRVFSKNTMRTNGVLDLATRELTPLPREPVAGNGRPVAPIRVSILPPAWCPSRDFSPARLGGADWHGEPVGMSPMPIAGNRFFWMRQTQHLVAYEGK
jgi:outer membrane protein assembly factor BamB